MKTSSSASAYEITLTFDHDDHLTDLVITRPDCGFIFPMGDIFLKFVQGKDIHAILNMPFETASKALPKASEEEKFYLYMIWDALRSAIARYLGIADKEFDSQRCIIIGIDHTEAETTIQEILLPPQNLPDIKL